MASVSVMLPEGELRCEIVTQTVTSEDAYYEWWKFTDAQGHRHAYTERTATGQVWYRGKRKRDDRATNFPTLRKVIDSRRRCDGHEGLYNHDPHWVEEGHRECLQCGEVIEPGHGPVSKPIVTGEYAYLNGQPISRERRDELITAHMQREAERRAAEEAARVTRSLGYPQAFA